MRIYLIASNRGVRLVRANTRAQALNYVASQELTVRVISLLLDFLRSGEQKGHGTRVDSLKWNCSTKLGCI